MQSIYNFLDFRLFISPVMLFVFYYLGAFFMPYAGWLIAKKVRKKFWLLADSYEPGQQAVQQIDSSNQQVFGQRNLPVPGKGRFVVLLAVLFIMLEIMWRILFEFLIAYFQMREALIGLSSH